jgi:hypothetical protein
VVVAMARAIEDGAAAIEMVVVAEVVVDGVAAAAVKEPAVGMLKPRLTKHTWKSAN